LTNVSAGLRLTGERTLPGIWHENYWFRRHEAAYAWVAQHVAGRSVLEAGCGEGYGAGLLLAAGAQQVVGVDYDAAAAGHVRGAYPQVPVLRGNLVALPLASESFDIVVSLQTVEHLWDQPALVAECVRVLRPRGKLVVSTPNRLTFSPGVPRGAKPLNPFHVKELDHAELVDLVAGACVVEESLGLHHGDRIKQWQRQHGSLVAAQLAAPYDQWASELVDLVKSLQLNDFDVSHDEIDDSLDLVVVGRKP
jgi:SAM-dependent methyltransferase